MKRIIVLSFVFVLATFSVFAQQRNCAAMDVLEEQLRQDPTLHDRMEAIERHTHAFEANPPLGTRAVVTIPVVVHVVYRTAAQNISDAQVQSQIDVLNADFRKLNTDASLTPSAFSGLVTDSEVNFCLAKRDPSGNSTNGILHYSTSRTTAFGTNDAVKIPSQGGIAPWNASKYLNIWVCDIGGGILGYAQFPGGSASTDGVVLDYRYTGKNGSSIAPFNLGRTATHEVGHWLNLRHIWGDANCGTDQVSDTPTQQTSNGGCPSFPHVTCSNGPNGDMFMNYMDYTNDACMYMFSTGQKTRMQAVLSAGGARASLATSDGCTPSSTVGCSAPATQSAGSITTTGATISWAAATSALNYTLEYKTAVATAYTAITVSGTSQVLTGLTAGTTYNYRLRTNCSSAVSTFTTPGSFTTTSTGTTCTDAYESNNTLSTAKPVVVNTSINALISATSDNDYFSFSNTATQKNIKVALSNIPAGTDYDLQLYRGTTLVKSSLNGGNVGESIAYNNGTIGTYTARVFAYSGASTSQCYILTVNIGSSKFTREIGAEEGLDDDFTIAPNPANDVLNVDWKSVAEAPATLRLFDLTGREVKRIEKELSKDNSIIQMPVSEISNGLYIISIQQGENKRVRKVVISH
jgi:hypothetical protein